MVITLVFSNSQCICTRKCILELSKGLRKLAEVNIVYYKDLTPEIYNSSDAVILQRIGSNGVNISDGFISNLTQYKNENSDVSLFYMLDDLLFSEATQRLINISNACIVFSKVYEKYMPGKKVYQLRTFIDQSQFNFINKDKSIPKDKFNVLYASTGSLGKRIVDEIKLQLKNKGVNIITITRTPYQQYLQLIKSVDLVINPFEFNENYMATEDFLNAKSVIKYIEAGALGKPIITSRNIPYSEIIQLNNNGIIVDTDSEWVYHILKLRDNKRLREDIGKRAQQDTLENYNVDKRAEDLVNIIKKHKLQVT